MRESGRGDMATWVAVVLTSQLLGGCGEADTLARGGAGAPCGQLADCGDGLLCADALCATVSASDTGEVYEDPATGLEWQAAPADGRLDWLSAGSYCEQLELDGGGWRLPDVEELRSLIRGCPASEPDGACGATNECRIYDVCLSDCSGCETNAGPENGCYWPAGLGGPCDWYWTSSALTDRSGAWYVVFSYAHVCGRSKDFSFGLVRCVR